jgi:hypothetical protein
MLRRRVMKKLSMMIRSVMSDLVQQEVASMAGDLTPQSMQLLAPAALQRLLDSAEWRDLMARTLPEVAEASSKAADLLREEDRRPASSLASTWNQETTKCAVAHSANHLYLNHSYLHS